MSADTAEFDLVVGLGNPGPKYEETRHNAGFWFLDALAERFQASLRAEKRFFGDYCKARVNGREVHLLKPGTFMNKSGQSIQATASYFKLNPDNILVVHDEIDLPAGTIRIKQGGGHGGHNGLRDTIAHIGKDFWRVRLGVGHPGHKEAVVGHVLKRASIEDQQLIDNAIVDGIDEAENLLDGRMNRAMQALHSRKH